MIDSLPPLVASIKLNFNGYSLNNLGNAKHTYLFSFYPTLKKKNANERLVWRVIGAALEVEILASLKGLLQTKALYLSNLNVEKDFAIVT